MTRIECTKCAEVIELMADVVMLPFVCVECEQADIFQDAMAPVSYPNLNAALAGKTVHHVEEGSGGINIITEDAMAPVKKYYPEISAMQNVCTKEFSVEPSHAALGDATVENTTLLIEDLEKQIGLQDESLKSATALIEDMSIQIDARDTEISKLNEHIEDQDEDITNVTLGLVAAWEFNSDLKDDLDAAYKRNISAAVAREQYINGLEAEIGTLKSQRAAAWEEVRRLEVGRDFYKEVSHKRYGRILDLRGDKERLYKRGLLDRIFNIPA